MPPKAKPTVEEVKQAYGGGIKFFFKPPPKPGRPPGPTVERRGRPAVRTSPPRQGDDRAPTAQAAAGSPATAAPAEAAASTPAPTAKASNPKASTGARVNWGKGDGLKRMTDAVKDWEEQTEQFLDLPEGSRSLENYAAHVGIPHSTLHMYVTKNRSKRRALGSSVGAPRAEGKGRRWRGQGAHED